MKLAIVGSGVAGLTVASELHSSHEITVFESEPHLGGHAWTVSVPHEGRTVPVDLGFMVFNTTTYPNFVQMLERLEVPTRETSMGFSVSDPASGLEYCGTNLDGVFAQRCNLLRPSFLRMLADILRFNREAPGEVERLGERLTLGEMIERGRYSRAFRDQYLAPMGAAIWSASERDLLRFPAVFFVRFFRNHGLLEPPERQLRWRTIEGGSRVYVAKLVAPFADRIRLRSPVVSVRRVPGGAGVDVTTAAGTERFDEVVLATHADTALRLIGTPTTLERQVLGAFRFQSNDTVLHTDVRVMPRRRNAWASWNYHLPGSADRPVAVTYDVSRLQGLPGRTPMLVTLNAADRIAPEHVLARVPFDHPLFTLDSLAAQARHAEVSGVDRLHYCGAWWQNGFHEDGVVSALAVARRIAARAVVA